MKFSVISHVPPLNLGVVVKQGKTVWSNEMETCVIILRDGPISKPPRPGAIGVVSSDTDRVSVNINGQHIWSEMVSGAMISGIDCADDGVVAFVVKEIMDFAIDCGRRGTWKIAKTNVHNLFKALQPVANLQNFHAYKEQQRGTE